MEKYKEWYLNIKTVHVKRVLPWHMHFDRHGRLKEGEKVYLPLRKGGVKS